MRGRVLRAAEEPATIPPLPGDRAMARLLLKALGAAGFAPSSSQARLRTLDRAGDAGLPGCRRRSDARAEADAPRSQRYRDACRPSERPRLWFTYHVYYKAPDWIGPAVSPRRCGIPYVRCGGLARAGKRAARPLGRGPPGAEAALDRADAIFVMTERGPRGSGAARPAAARASSICRPSSTRAMAGRRPARRPRRRRRRAAAHRRDDAARRQARLLPHAGRRLCASCRTPAWTLDIVGDGEARREVETLFADLGDRCAVPRQRRRPRHACGVLCRAPISSSGRP